MSTIKVDTIQSRQHSSSTISLTSTGATVNGDCTATTFSGSGASLTSLPAANLTGTLPALSAANLTAIPAANITGTLPAIDGSNLTGVGGGGFEFVKTIQPSANTTTITETGLDYDSIYRLVCKQIVFNFTTELRFNPHLDNNSTKFTYSSAGECSHIRTNLSGSSESTRQSFWVFDSGYNSYYWYGHMDFSTTEYSWIIGSLRGYSASSFSIIHGKKNFQTNTGNDSNQTGTYAKINGFTLESDGGWSFTPETKLILFKHKES